MTAPRLDPARETAILDAVLALLTEVGHDRMSIDEVARRARASKATIYRRWSGKAAMVAALMHRMALDYPPLPDTGSLRGDLVAGLRTFCRELSIVLLLYCSDVTPFVVTRIMGCGTIASTFAPRSTEKLIFKSGFVALPLLNGLPLVSFSGVKPLPISVML